MISLSTASLVVPNLITFDPAILTQELTLWTPLTCHFASTSILELTVVLLVFNFLINQLQPQTWTLNRFSLMFISSCILQSLSYWCFWMMANLIVPRRWIIGDISSMCGLSSLMTFVLLIIRMEQP